MKSTPAMWPKLAYKRFGVCHHVNQVIVHYVGKILNDWRRNWRWVLIIHKIPGFGVEQLRDNCMDTYWQSDGQLPHLVNIQFQRKTSVNQIYIYTDYKLDESYTPSRISIRSGTHFNDLQEIEIVDLVEPTGINTNFKLIHKYQLRDS